MARLIGPDMGSRAVFLPNGRPAAGKTGVVFADAVATTIADVAAYQPGNPSVPGATIPGSIVTVDGNGLLPLFWFPDGVDRLWVSVNGGPVVPIDADNNARLDALELAAQGSPANINPLAQGAKADYTGRYGTVGSGTDSRAGIQAALNNASSLSDSSYYGYTTRRSTTVKLPSGHYVISAPSGGTASLKIPAGVLLDATDATLYFDYPASAASTWCAIEVGQYAQLRVGKVYTSGRNSAPDSALVYDAVRLVMTDNNSRVVGYGDSEIRGFQGAGVRLVGSWISYIKGIRFTGLAYGLVASNRGDGTLGYALPVGNPSGARRVVTDTRVEDCQFINISNGGFRGTVSGNAADVNALDNTDSGLTVSFYGCVFESIGTYAASVTNAFTLSLFDCGFEEVGAADGMLRADNVRAVVAEGTRINLAGRSVPGPSGTVTPSPSQFLNLTSAQTVHVEGMYCHNTLVASFALANAAPSQGYHVGGLYTDANAFAAGPMFVGRGGHAFPGAWDRGHVAIGSRRLWVDANGSLRHKNSAPSSDLDGVALAASNLTAAPLASGLYYVAGAGSIGTNQPAEASELAVPWVAGRSATLVELAASVTTAGAAGALLRLGVRADNAGQPGAVLADAGTAAADTTGVKTRTISLPVVEGTLYWLTLTVQGATATRPTIQSTSGTHDPRIGHASASTLLSMAAGLYQSGGGTTAGALPGSQTWSAASTVPRIAVKA